jgi:hypothetical protein
MLSICHGGNYLWNKWKHVEFTILNVHNAMVEWMERRPDDTKRTHMKTIHDDTQMSFDKVKRYSDGLQTYCLPLSAKSSHEKSNRRHNIKLRHMARTRNRMTSRKLWINKCKWSLGCLHVSGEPAASSSRRSEMSGGQFEQLGAAPSSKLQQSIWLWKFITLLGTDDLIFGQNLTPKWWMSLQNYQYLHVIQIFFIWNRTESFAYA